MLNIYPSYFKMQDSAGISLGITGFIIEIKQR